MSEEPNVRIERLLVRLLIVFSLLVLAVNIARWFVTDLRFEHHDTRIERLESRPR